MDATPSPENPQDLGQQESSDVNELIHEAEQALNRALHTLGGAGVASHDDTRTTIRKTLESIQRIDARACKVTIPLPPN